MKSSEGISSSHQILLCSLSNVLLVGLDKLKKLSVLYMSNNMVASWSEIERHLTALPELTDLCFINNPLERCALGGPTLLAFNFVSPFCLLPWYCCHGVTAQPPFGGLFLMTFGPLTAPQGH